MTTPEVTRHLSKSEPSTTGEGPVPEGTGDVSQGLMDKHFNLAAKPNDATDRPLEDHDQPYVNEPEPRQDRVMSTGARTPNSLVAEIEALVERNAVKRNSEGEVKLKDTEREASQNMMPPKKD
ncbi:Fc.00g074940.m01.CDS01 [Cosmosporella sp. VM-42]